MKKHLSLFLLLLVVFSNNFWANENQLSIFNKANLHYENEEYQEAKEIYLSLLEEQFISDDLHFNLGNAYFKNNQIANAILHYEKSLKINPGNKDAAYNLKLANQKTVDKIEAIPELFIYRWWKSIYNLLSADQWAKLSITLFLLCTFPFLLFLFIDKIKVRKASFFSACTTVCLAFVCWFFAFQQKKYLLSKEHAVILEPSVNIISAPSEGSSQLFVLHEGTKVKLLDETGYWFKVSLPNGNEGWLKKQTIEAI